MTAFPHYEIVIRYADGVAWAGTVSAKTDAAARRSALARFRKSKARASGAGRVSVVTNYRASAASGSILG